MNCEQVQEVLSARMDGEYLSAAQAEAADAHAEACAACLAFAERSGRVRTAVRIRAAEPVPDLTGPIMAAVARERVRPPRSRHAMSLGPRRGRRIRKIGPALAAAIAGVLVGSLLVGGPWQRPDRGPIAVAAVARSVRDEARSIDAFQGTYRIDERGLSPAVPERRLEMDVAFLAPQRFRLDVHDRTTYPSRAWTPTDLVYIEDMPATYRSGPTGCPSDLAPGVCPPTRTTVTRVSAFSAAAPLPADLILPIATFGSVRGVRVVGEESMQGRQTLRVEMSFARATPLFPFLRLGGTWRPFFDGDRVTLWLDTTSWFPVRYEVVPSSDPARRAWEMRFGLPPEGPGQPIFDVTAESVGETPPPTSQFAIPGLGLLDEVPLAQAPSVLGYVPSTPTEPGDLRLVSVVVPRLSTAGGPPSLLVYANGLEYLRLGEDPRWDGPGPFGPVDASSQEVALQGGRIVFYEPAGEGLGRRLAIHAADTDLYLETNLARKDLFSIASSIPVRGEGLPKGWRVEATGALRVERIRPSVALSIAGMGAMPMLPDGYVFASARRESSRRHVIGVTFTFRQRVMDAAGPALTLHVEPHAPLPPASSADQSRVQIGTTTGRWTPSRSLVEWVAGDSYRSLQGTLDLRSLLTIALSISREAGG